MTTDTVTMTREEYEDLVDARDHAIAMLQIGAGATLISEGELDAYLAAGTPLAFFRARADLTQTILAERSGISQAYVAQIETGKRIGAVDVYARLTRALGVRIEDLIVAKDK